MQYVWQHRLWRTEDMVTNDGRRVRVLDPGLLNTDSGPDFFNAKVEIDGHVWVGNIEIHVRASDWRRHGHDKDKAYDNVILHVVGMDDAPVTRSNGERIPQVVLECSPRFNESYQQLVTARNDLPCAEQLSSIPHLHVTEWIEALAFERLYGKVEHIQQLLTLYCNSWEDVCYVTLARNLGFGINSDAFERLARRTPLRLLHKHSDQLTQVEALLFGQSGLLEAARTSSDGYCRTLCREYDFLANKFTLTPMEGEAWKLFRIRPQNFPHRRIAMLAGYVHGGFNLMSSIVEAPDLAAVRELFNVTLTGYWAGHYHFGGDGSNQNASAIGRSSIDIVLINTVVPLLYAWGVQHDDDRLTRRAVAILEDLKSEENSIVATFRRAGIRCDDALTSQALIQLRREYCDKRKCVYCRFGHRILTAAAKLPK